MNDGPQLKITPDFVGVGGAKTGSSWIFQCLDEHPEICGSRPKETNFFRSIRPIGKKELETSGYEHEGREGYGKYFSHCAENQIKGEFTTAYFHDKAAARLLARYFPDLKIIISLRNPVDRVFSMYTAAKDKGGFKTFEEAIEKESEFIRRSFYTEYVEEYLRLFPSDQIHIIVYEHAIKSPAKTIQELYRFLGVDSSFVSSSAHRSIRSRSGRTKKNIYHKLQRVPFGSVLFSVLNRVRIIKIVTSLYGAKKRKINPKTRDYLYGVFEEDINDLEKLLNKNLSIWRDNTD